MGIRRQYGMSFIELLILIILCAGGYWLWAAYNSPEPTVAATATTAAATGAVAGAAAATGFWALLWTGGWFLGELTLGLWFLLGSIIFVPLGIIALLSELPDSRGYQEFYGGTRIVGSLILFSLMLFLLNWGGIPLWSALKEHTIYVGLSLVAFIAIGVAWSVFKYDLLARDCKEEINRVIEVFCMKTGMAIHDVLGDAGGKTKFTVPERHRDRWQQIFESNCRMRVRSSGVTADSPFMDFKKNKERISLWILFWPSSMLRGLFKDILARALDALIMSLRRTYDAIAKRHAIEVVYSEPAAGAVASAEPEQPAPHRGGYRV